MRVLVFGDSITQGFWDVEYGGWVARIRQYFDRLEQKSGRDAATIFNLGVSADTSDDLLKRMDNEIIARNNGEHLVVVITIGVNDSKIKSGKTYTEPDLYKEKLEQLLKTGKKYTKSVLFVGLTPCVDERTHPVAWGDIVYDNKRLELFDNALRTFCEEHEVQFIDVFPAFSKEQEKRDLLPDGLHPNDDGHQLMADLVLPKIKELVG